MQILALLFLMLGVVVIMFAAFVCLSYSAGVYWYSREGAVIRRPDPNPCAQCDADQDWYLTQSIWKRNVIAAWWWANRLTWAGKGCK